MDVKRRALKAANDAWCGNVQHCPGCGCPGEPSLKEVLFIAVIVLVIIGLSFIG